MTSSIINNEQFKNAISVAFIGDKHIYNVYCPYIKIKSVDDIVNDISKRIFDDVPEAMIKGVYEKNELIGYYVYNNKTLVSFALNINYRSRKYLKEFWSKIRADLKGEFNCLLWSVNIRGWKWLQKMGMKIVFQDDLLIQLKY